MKHRVLKEHKVTNNIYVLADVDDEVVYIVKEEDIGVMYRIMSWVPYFPSGARVPNIGAERNLRDIINRLKWGV